MCDSMVYDMFCYTAMVHETVTRKRLTTVVDAKHVLCKRGAVLQPRCAECVFRSAKSGGAITVVQGESAEHATKLLSPFHT